jgi:hypothetical protein
MPGFPTPTNVVGVNANRRDPTNRGKARRYNFYPSLNGRFPMTSS